MIQKINERRINQWQEEEIGIIFQRLFARSAVRKCRFRDGMDIEEKKGHIKDLYCPKCKKIQKFKEFNNKQFYKTLDGEVISA